MNPTVKAWLVGIATTLPVALLALKITFKILIADVPDGRKFWLAMTSLPFDMIFLSASFFIAYSTSPGNQAMGSSYFIYSMVFGALVTYLWRKSEQYYNEEKYFGWIALSTINYAISITALALSYELVKK